MPPNSTLRRCCLLLALCGGLGALLALKRATPAARAGAAARATGPNTAHTPAEARHPAAQPDPTVPRAEPPATAVAPAATRARALFSFVQPPHAAALTAALPAPASEVRYVRIDRELVRGKQSPFWQKSGAGHFDLPLPDGTHWRVAIEETELLGPDRFTSRGRIEGRPHSQAVLAWNAGFLHASFEDFALGRFALRAATADVAQFYQIDPQLLPPCPGGRSPARAASNAGPPAPAPEPPANAAVENPQAAEVHVMMAHTQAVLPTLAGAARTAALQSAFDHAIAKTNATFEASLVTTRVKLVRIVETSYDENASQATAVMDDALTAVYRTDDGKMDELHALRDAAGADVVFLVVNRASAMIGLSFLLDEPAGFGNAEYAFSVLNYNAIAGTNVLSHELGHVMGCAHARGDPGANGTKDGAFPYSYGYRFRGADFVLYHDIMAYAPGTELAYFSNPEITLPAPIGVPIGVPEGRPGESNTALTIERMSFVTAGYRLQTQAPAAGGALVNVATRAFVGTGDAVLIGGFVLDGAQPKSLLIRAAGPALASFGVRDALVDPVLRVYAGGTLTAENDDWGQPAGAVAAGPGAVAAAAGAVRAFSFAAGSADAAVLVSLAPGAYTAVVEGARGTTGSAIVEAYEVQREPGRIVNLATRGFASREQEMYGGFVVQGAPGGTKRILIRVLGPSLTRAPFLFANALDDPEMELRNAAGELLIANDDWSSGVVEPPASPVNDFRPRVQFHAETRIFATGLAPANRREPCILADLPPGNYTIIVRPFERRSANPADDQPAAPGVGVMEVYEIR